MAGKHEGMLLWLGISCLGKLPAAFDDVCTFIARNQLVSYSTRIATTTSRRPRRPLAWPTRGSAAWGHAAVFAWSDLILDRIRQARWSAVARRLRPRLVTPVLILITTTTARHPKRSLSVYPISPSNTAPPRFVLAPKSRHGLFGGPVAASACAVF